LSPPIRRIAARLPVPHDRRVKPVAHVLEIALQCGGSNLERFEEALKRNHLAVVQELVDLVESLGPTHGTSLRSRETRGWNCKPSLAQRMSEW
jgi:hypothetical protein